MTNETELPPLRVKPARPKMVVRHPGRGYAPISAEGETVPRTSYWMRRLRDGDVVELDPAPAPPSTPKRSPR